ncbi:glycosyltransferase [Rhodococcoides fascians]|uniref:glycosyltransferase n=1 Tax=Rhodococcoides fascians TaxID=1828 RepID=UPI0009B815B1|nr:glycosyltransferase [Rhodococcus fascians]
MSGSSVAGTSQPGRIAVVVPSLTGGGAEGVARAWATALVNEGKSVDVLLTHSDVGTHQVANVRFVSGQSESTVKRIVLLRKQIRDQQYQTVFSVMTFTNLIVLLAVLALPRDDRPKVVISEHNLHTRLAKIYGVRFRIQMILCRIFYRTASAWIAVSHAVASEMCAIYKLPPDSMWIVLNPMEKESPRQPVAQQKATGDPKELQIVFAGRLVPQKNPFLLIEIAKLAKLDGRLPVINFIGDGPLTPQLEQMCAQFEVPCKFYGWVDDWTIACPGRGVLVLTSLFEGLGNVLIEAAFAGVPAVVSDRALGSADACIPGVTAGIASDYSPHSFYMALCDAECMEVTGIDDWLKQFTLKAAGSRLIDISESLTPDLAGELARGRRL